MPSTHRCDVVRVRLRPHPNADSLSLVSVFGWECVVRTSEWMDGDLAVFVPPESVIPDTDEVLALGGAPGRVRAVRLRGVLSPGLLLRAPDGATEGDDLMARLGVTHYEPPLPLSAGGEAEAGPPGAWTHYDVENLRSRANASLLLPGEETVATEKIHGTSARYVWTDSRQWVGSHAEWKREDPNSVYWRALAQCPRLGEWCRAHQDLAAYGEVFGPAVQDTDYGYGAVRNDVLFVAFDILDHGRWLDFDDARRVGDGLPWVPLLYRGPFDEAAMKELAEGDSTVPGAGHIREGLVVKPVRERWCAEIGRVQLKVVSNQYLAGKAEKRDKKRERRCSPVRKLPEQPLGE